MRANLEKQDDDILYTIDLTSKLQQSLRKLLTKKKPFEFDQPGFSSPKSEKSDAQLLKKIQALKQENKELYSDNQQLSKELLSVKEELRQCQKQLASTKKYLQFLQSYNDDLKKEMLFWMKDKKETLAHNEPSNMGNLMSKIIKLRKENQDNEKKLLSLKDTLEIKTENTYSQTRHQRSLNFDLSKFQNQLINKNRSFQTKVVEENACTSCKRKSQSKSKMKKLDQSSNYDTKNEHGKKSVNKGKNLRKWHNHYVSHSDYAI